MADDTPDPAKILTLQQQYSNLIPEPTAASNEALTMMALNPKDVLDELEHDLRGEHLVYDTNGVGKWEKQEGHEVMNEHGVQSILSVVKLCGANRNVFLSNLTEEKIAMIMEELNLAMIERLSMGWQEFNIKKEDLTLIEDRVIFFIYYALCRALDQGERIFFTHTSQERRNIIVDERPRDDKRSFWSKLKPF